MNELILIVGKISAFLMPFWNIPLIIKIIKRKSADDISIVWVLGVWICIIGMLPSAMKSADSVFKVFGIVNSVLFSGVLVTVLKYRKR